MRKSKGNVKDWAANKLLTKQDWRSLERVLIPLNIENKHWILAEVVIDKKRVRVYDSMKTARSVFYVRELCERLPYLHRVFTMSLEEGETQPWVAELVESVPQQGGGYYIKLYLHYIYCLSPYGKCLSYF
ncbi:unnamed protein product [Cuscuta epithymum]|uniref:Ubiquitin-like protease family profile domain-containing protein n=1 Tax=Cuscuta epithymum TaxID=186058 RepID=A0AAV0DKN1_9ASTE|nr:unnamed protein product [Cuscuta epithymum]CAH9100907.1 unnamed protein product [Cuscuta epithymum]